MPSTYQLEVAALAKAKREAKEAEEQAHRIADSQRHAATIIRRHNEAVADEEHADRLAQDELAAAADFGKAIRPLLADWCAHTSPIVELTKAIVRCVNEADARNVDRFNEPIADLAFAAQWMKATDNPRLASEKCLTGETGIHACAGCVLKAARSGGLAVTRDALEALEAASDDAGRRSSGPEQAKLDRLCACVTTSSVAKARSPNAPMSDAEFASRMQGGMRSAGFAEAVAAKGMPRRPDFVTKALGALSAKASEVLAAVDREPTREEGMAALADKAAAADRAAQTHIASQRPPLVSRNAQKGRPI